MILAAKIVLLYRGLAEMSGQDLCFRMISSRRPDTIKCPRHSSDRGADPVKGWAQLIDVLPSRGQGDDAKRERHPSDCFYETRSLS